MPGTYPSERAPLRYRVQYTKVVAPQPLVSHHSVLLSNLDTSPTLAGVTVFGALFFSRPISPRRFEDALAAALSRFPILAGRTRRVPNSGPPLFSTSEVFCANQGAALVVCDCSGSLSDFDAHACPEVLGRHTQRKDNHTPPGFIPRDFPATSGAIPKGGATGDVLAAFQLTRLSCGGCAVGHAISHAIVDGASVGLFLQTLADAFASAPDPSPFSSSDTADVIPSYGGSPVIPFTPLAPPPPSSTAPSSTTSASPTSSALSLSLPPSEAPIFDRAKLVAAASRPPVGKGDPEHASRRAAALLEAQPLLRCVSSAVRYKVALSRREAEMLFVSLPAASLAAGRSAASAAGLGVVNDMHLATGFAWALLRDIRSRPADAPPRLGGRHALSQVVDLRRVLSSLRPSFFGNAIWVARLESPPSPSPTLVPSSFPPTPAPSPTPPNHPRYGALLAASLPRPTGPLCLAAAARDAHAAIAASSAIYDQVAAALSGRGARGAAGLRRLTQPGFSDGGVTNIDSAGLYSLVFGDSGTPKWVAASLVPAACWGCLIIGANPAVAPGAYFLQVGVPKSRAAAARAAATRLMEELMGRGGSDEESTTVVNTRVA